MRSRRRSPSGSRSPLSELPPSAHGGVSDAHYRKEFLVLERKYDSLVKKHKSAVERLDRAKSDRHGLRGDVESYRKEVTKLRRMVTKLGNDNKKLDEELSTAKDFNKRVESRLVHGSNGKYVLEQNAKLRDQLNALKAETADQQKLISSQETELQKATQEVEVLSRAMELRAEELKLDGDKAGMLYTVARYKQDTRNLTLDLADRTRRNLELESTVEALQAQLDEVVVQRSVATERAAISAADLDEERERARELVDSVDKLSRERDVTLEYVQELAGKIAHLTKRASDAEAEAAALKSDKLSSRIALQAVESKSAQLRKVQEVTEDSLASIKGKYNEAVSQAAKAEATVTQQAQELSTLHADIQTLEADVEALRTRAEEAEAGRHQLQSQIQELSSDNVQLRATADRAVAEQATSEADLQATVDRLQEELRESQDAREHTAASLREVTAKQLVSVREADALRDTVARLETELEALKRSKTMLQQTLVSQLGQVRDELAREKRHAGTPALSSARAAAPMSASVRHMASLEHTPPVRAELRPPPSTSPRRTPARYSLTGTTTSLASGPRSVTPPQPPSRSETPSVSKALLDAQRASLEAADAVRESEEAELEYQRLLHGTTAALRPAPAGTVAAQAAALREIEQRVAAAEASVRGGTSSLFRYPPGEASSTRW